MTEKSEGSKSAEPPPRRDNVLGFSTSELAGLSVDELSKNKTAIKMMLHYYKQLDDENAALKNDVNTLRTYVDAYRKSRLHSKVGGWLQLLGTIVVGLGINLVTNDKIPDAAAWSVLLGGVLVSGFGVFFTLSERD